MHYTGMAAVQAQAAPGLVVNTADTAGATAFLLPLILGLSAVGFIFSAVIALSPTAAEIVEEGELMKRIGQSQAARYEPQGWRPPPAQPYQPYQAPRDEPGLDEPGSLFRPRRPSDRALALPGRPHIRTLDRSQEQRGRVVRKNETTRSLALAPSSHGPAGHCCQAVSPL